MKGGPGTSDPGLVTCWSCSVYALVSTAYNLQSWEFAAPSSTHDVRYDIQAKVPEGVTHDQMLSMLQNLLAERLRVVVHREPRNLKTYELSVAKGGPKLRAAAPRAAGSPATVEGPVTRLPKDEEGWTALPPGIPHLLLDLNGDRERLTARMQTVADLVSRLKGILRGARCGQHRPDGSVRL